MVHIVDFGRVQTVCKRYGPGRLPGAERPDVGAGYAGASAALAAAAVWVIVAQGILTIRDPGGIYGAGYWETVANLWTAGLYAIPIVVPTAFLVGAYTWRLTDILPGWGWGILATVGTYVGSYVLLALIFFIYGDSPVDSAIGALFFVVVGLYLTFWVTLPIGVVSGTIYARTAPTGSPDQNP